MLNRATISLKSLLSCDFLLITTSGSLTIATIMLFLLLFGNCVPLEVETVSCWLVFCLRLVSAELVSIVLAFCLLKVARFIRACKGDFSAIVTFWLSFWIFENEIVEELKESLDSFSSFSNSNSAMDEMEFLSFGCFNMDADRPPECWDCECWETYERFYFRTEGFELFLTVFYF